MVSDKTLVEVVAIAALAAIEIAAMFKGYDGMLFSAIVIAISGIGGFYFGKRGNNTHK